MINALKTTKIKDVLLAVKEFLLHTFKKCVMIEKWIG